MFKISIDPDQGKFTVLDMVAHVLFFFITSYPGLIRYTSIPASQIGQKQKSCGVCGHVNLFNGRKTLQCHGRNSAQRSNHFLRSPS